MKSRIVIDDDDEEEGSASRRRQPDCAIPTILILLFLFSNCRLSEKPSNLSHHLWAPDFPRPYLPGNPARPRR